MITTKEKEFWENTPRIEAVEFGNTGLPSEYVPARIGERKGGVFRAVPLDQSHVEVSSPSGNGKHFYRQVIELVRLWRGHGTFLCCPRCKKKRRCLFFITNETPVAIDFSFMCMKCALAILGPTPRDRFQVIRRRRHK